MVAIKNERLPMNKKYKIKKHTTISNFYIIVIAITIMQFFGVGYSMFSTTLTIQATATAKKSDTDLPIDIPTTPGGTDYVSMTVDNNVLEIVSQSIDGNTVNVNLKPTTSTGKPRGMNIQLDFINHSGYTYTNGTVAYEVSGNTSFVPNKPTTTVTTTLQQGETGTFTANFTGAKFNSLTTTCTCKFTITYLVNGQEVQFVISLNFTR